MLTIDRASCRAHSVRRLLAMSVLLMACGQGLASAASLSPSEGSHWQKLDTDPYKGKQDDIYFVNQDLGFYINGKGNIWRSNDGGRSWQNVLKQPGTYFRAIGMVDTRHGFAGNIGTDYYPGVTDNTPLYETNDGGDHWAPVAHLPGPAMRGICAIDVLHLAGQDPSSAIIDAAGRVGGPARLLRSLDGGKTWINIDMTPWLAMITDVKFFDAKHGMVFGGTDVDLAKSHGVVVSTDDGGVHWKRVYESARPSELIWKGAFGSRQVGYATLQNYDTDTKVTQRWVVKTVDGGKRWKELPLVDDKEVMEFGVGFANADLGWVGTTKGGFETRDGGLHWEHVALGRVVNKFRILPQGQHFTAFAIGSDVYKYTNEHMPATPAANTPVSIGKP